MLSPLSVSRAMSSDGGPSEADAFMSGSGSTMVGSSPGCQRSMLSSEPPSEAFPKNRLAVLMLKPSREGANAPGEFLGSSDDEPSSFNGAGALYCGSGGAFMAACNSGSSDPEPDVEFGAGAAAVFAPMTDEFEVAGSSRGGGISSGRPVSGSIAGGVATTRRSPFSVRSTRG